MRVVFFLFWSKVNSVQEACAKCFAVHILNLKSCKSNEKKWNNGHQTLSFQFFINRSCILMFHCFVFHVVCKISNFNMWTAKHLVQASCTELTLLKLWQFYQHILSNIRSRLNFSTYWVFEPVFRYVWSKLKLFAQEMKILIKYI